LTKAETVSLFVVISRPVLEVAVNAGAAVRVRPEHVTTTEPASNLADGDNCTVILFPSNFDVAVTAGEDIPHWLSDWVAIIAGGKVNVILFAEDSSRVVEVVNETVAAPLVPTLELNVNAAAVIDPTAGMVTYAGMESLDVSIFKPFFPSIAGFAANVKPEQVTVTRPAAKSLVTTKMILSLLKDEVVTA